MQSYWAQVMMQRASRRRALVVSGGFGVGAAFLAACGGSDAGGGTGTGPGAETKPTSSLLAKIEDTSSKAKRGGVMKWTSASEPLHFDGQAQGQAQLNIYNGMTHDSLVRNKPGIGEPSRFNEVLPNLSESWEVSPDKLTITFKLRQGVKFHNIPPVSGRAFDSADVLSSMERYVGHPTPNNSAVNFNSKSPAAPILGWSAPDARTVVLKLKEPTSFILARLTVMITGEIGAVYPREAGTGYDPRRQQIGTGGYQLERHEPSVGLFYKRNPEYWNKDAVYVDSLEVPFINQAPARDAQLKAGAVYAVGGLADISPDNVIRYKKDEPRLSMYSFVTPNNNASPIQRFGWKDLNGRKSPFLDVRVRQAISMGMDRDAYIDAFSNISNFEKEGLPVESFYNTSMGSIPGLTLNPRNEKEFGPNAKYFKHDVAEAKKLLAAAGFASGFDYENSWPNFPAFGPNFPKQIAVIESFNQDIGLRPKSRPIDYNLEYLPKLVTQRGQHEGIGITLGAVTSPDPVDYFVWRYYSKSGPTSGMIFGEIGSGDGAGDPRVDEMIDKAKAEFDAKKQAVILADMQRYLAEKMYCVAFPGSGTQFTLAWPVVKNYLAFQGDSRAINSFYYTWWLDENEPPLKKG